MAAMVDDAKAKGARVVSGGERIDGPGMFFQPTVLADVPIEADIMNDEPFGPVALFCPFDTPDRRSNRPTACPSVWRATSLPRTVARRTASPT